MDSIKAKIAHKMTGTQVALEIHSKRYLNMWGVIVFFLCISSPALVMGKDIAVILNGNGFDSEDHRKIQNSFEFGPSGQTTSWVNASSGNSITITPQAAYSHQSSNLPCRKAEIKAISNSQSEQVTIVSCRDKHGTWNIQIITSRQKTNHQPTVQTSTKQNYPAQNSPDSNQNNSRRAALVVGNSHYQHSTPLPNPLNDAQEIGRVLTKLGFDTEVVLDASKTMFDSALRRFGNRSENAGAALFFYSGHGLEVDGINYLLPIDAQLLHKRDLKYETVALNGILEDMEGASNIRLVFLDACRSNPFVQTLARGMGTSRSVVGRGLAKVDTTTGTMISYATKDGSIASDGTGNHSPYTRALLKHLNTEGLEVGLMLRRVRQSVVNETDEKQVPWEYGSLMGEFYMVQ